eukprot:gene2249-17186_t
MTENTPRSAWADHDFERFATLSDRLHTTRQQVKYLQNSGDENDYFSAQETFYTNTTKSSTRTRTTPKKMGTTFLRVNSKEIGYKHGCVVAVVVTQFVLVIYIWYFDVLFGEGRIILVTNIDDFDIRIFNIDFDSDITFLFAQYFTNRATLLDRYIAIAYDDGPMRTPTVQQDDSTRAFGTSGVDRVCPHCESTQHMLNMQDGCIVCMQCRSVEYILIDHDKPTYKDPPKDAACFAYKRINHLNEWLNQVQGKETTEIPEDVFMNIIMEIKKQKITNMATLTPKRIRAILKKIDSNKYYEHIPHIMHRLNGIPTIHMPPDLEDKVRCMFCAIQIPFLKYQPPKRKNFLSYSYCLHKMMQLLEKDQYLVNFPLLKSREKLYQQDQIWKKICEDVRWDFIPSL